MPASAPKATIPPAHMPTPVLRPGQKGTPQKCQNLRGGGGFCHQMPPCSHHTPATHVTCWHTFSLSVRSTCRDTSRAYLKSQPPHRHRLFDTLGTGWGAFQPQAELSPQSHLSAEAQGRPPSPWRPNTRPKQPKMIRLFDPEPKAFPGRTS